MSIPKIFVEDLTGSNPAIPSGSGVFGALSGTAHIPKSSDTCPSRCPFLYRTIVKRPAMTGSRLGRYAETGQPPGL
ncbi:MAG: hypothetical protein Q8R70_12435 [Methanoregula sp.]|nr:hypothetical protein [Methanoregula sp.]